MQVMEFAKESGVALALTLAPENSEAFAQEFRQVKAALLDWHAKNGSRCELVMFTVVTAPVNHPAIESLLHQVYHEEAELAPLLQTVNVEVALLDNDGEPRREYTLGRSARSASANKKPWWQFW